MNGFKVVRRVFAVTTTVVVLAWLVGGFAVGFGWQVPKSWDVGLLGALSSCLVWICIVGIPTSELLEVEMDS